MNMSESAPRLLGLPAEIRIQIYWYATVAFKGYVEISVRPPRGGPPGLLATCRQIREEASKLYYGQNYFLFSVAKVNPDDLPRLSSQTLGMMANNFDICIVRGFNRKNIMEWLMRIHKGGVERLYYELQYEDSYCGDEFRELFNTACRLAHDMQDQEWSRLQGHLNGMVSGLRALCYHI